MLPISQHFVPKGLTFNWLSLSKEIEKTVSPEGTFCDTVQIPSSVGDMELI